MSPLDRAKQLLYRVFGLLPKPARMFIVRIVSPNWTAGAVAIIEVDGEWLMVNPVYRKGWTLPGGLVDRGEDPATTIVRELGEELGLEVELAPGDPWVLVDSRMRRVDLVFHATIPADVDRFAITSRSPELSAAGWFSADALPVVDREASDVFTLIDQVRGGGTRVLVR